jgi:hypothetical protein
MDGQDLMLSSDEPLTQRMPSVLIRDGMSRRKGTRTPSLSNHEWFDFQSARSPFYRSEVRISFVPKFSKAFGIHLIFGCLLELEQSDEWG